MTLPKPFLSDNAAAVHPRLWEAMRAADSADNPYDGDALSQELDARFSVLFGRECAALWVATGTAAAATGDRVEVTADDLGPFGNPTSAGVPGA